MGSRRACQRRSRNSSASTIAAEGIDPSTLGSKELEDALIAKAHEKYDQKEAIIGAPAMRYHERMIMLQIVDSHWKDHLLAMDHLKEGIGLRGYGQRDPLVEYKKESYDLFEDLMNRIEEDTLRFLFLLQPVEEKKQAEQIERKQKRQEMILNQSGRRRRRSRRASGETRRAQGWPKRSLSVRQRQEIQKMSWSELFERKEDFRRCVHLRRRPDCSAEIGHPAHRSPNHYPTDQSNRIEHSHRQRRHGHRHGIAPGDCARAAGRHRHHSQEHVDREAGRAKWTR